MLIASFVCIEDWGEGETSIPRHTDSFFLFLIEYKESLYAIREQIIFPLPVVPWQEEAVFSRTKGYIDHSE